MLATVASTNSGPRPPTMASGDYSVLASQIMSSPGGISSSLSAPSSSSLTLHASATATQVSDTELTNLGWLQKPGVLSSMCTGLGESPQEKQQQQQQQHQPPHAKPGMPVRRRPRQAKSNESRGECSTSRSSRSSDKMVNVILNARNRKYDGGDAIKPPLSFACMIFMAVESSPTKTLPVKEIYDWVMWKFPYYQSAPPGWKNSVRHNLSLHKCFKKVERRYSLKSGSAVTKGGLWTVDPDYRRSLLSALKRTPYHPYHSYFTPPLSPSSSNSSLESVDPAERDAALTMCMISGSSEQSESGLSALLHAVIHDHCYTKCPVLPVPSPPDSPCPQVTVKLNTAAGRSRRKSNKNGLTLDEIAAAAELILAQDVAEGKPEGSGSESSDEGFGGEVESDSEEDQVEADLNGVDLADSGYGANTSSAMETSSALDEMGADALLCLATGSKSTPC